MQVDFAFPAILGFETSTPTGDTAVFIDTAVSHHMIPAESRHCQHEVNKIDCSVYVEGSCGLPSATSKGTLAFRTRKYRVGLVPTHLDVTIVPGLGASVFSVGTLHDKGVKLDLLCNPPVIRDGNDAFPISTKVPRMFVLHILVNGQEEPQHTSHIAVDTDMWH